jgi:hypothetical protein
VFGNHGTAFIVETVVSSVRTVAMVIDNTRPEGAERFPRINPRRITVQNPRAAAYDKSRFFGQRKSRFVIHCRNLLTEFLLYWDFVIEFTSMSTRFDIVFSERHRNMQDKEKQKQSRGSAEDCLPKKSYLKLLPSAIFYGFMGNALSGVMTFSLGLFRGNTVVMLMATIFALTIYVTLIAVPAYKDGLTDGRKVAFRRAKQERQGGGKIPGIRQWTIVGMVVFAVMIIPSVAFLFGGMGYGVYRLLSGVGVVAPLCWILIGESTATTANPLLSWAPFVFVGLYALCIPAIRLGYVWGLNDKFSNPKKI